ncbi:putative protein YhaN [Abditibacterium utsteinense]|uniref:Rad50/SbcC-type AAA domain-containing protein n=2 Tax=Abditibacterium utsteinense TaxID=1960156 RepID=A0A2S8SV52_9BACT|nr:putative protein YhaN [Abditibacterium utsteinense]
MTLETGLNVLQGRNEVGKSSIVEAIDWALHRDITGARLKAEEVRSIVPASDPNARPSVEVELEFSDCRASILKILGEDAGKRECRLIIRRDGQADEFFDRTEAQNRLRALFSADGLGEERASIAGGALLISHQGESIDFLCDGQAAIRSTIGVGNDGQIALTARLERARTGIEALRKKEMLQDLESSAIQTARAGTEAARARDALLQACEQRAHFVRVEREIEELRRQIEEIETQLREITPRENEAQQKVEALGALLIQQGEADKGVLLAQGAEREAKIALDETRKRADEIARLRDLQFKAKAELENSQSALLEAETALQEASKCCDEAATRRDETQQSADETRHCADAWRHYLAVFEAQVALKTERKSLETLENLGAAVREKQKERDVAPKAPGFEEMRVWRAAFETLKNLESEAARGVQVEILAQTALEVGWKADGASLQKQSLGEGERTAFGALGAGVLKIAGVGALRIKTGARGVEELKAEVETARAALEKQLGEWKIGLDFAWNDAEKLDSFFVAWETRRTFFEECERAWKEAVEDLKREENRVGALSEAQKRLAAREEEYLSAKNECKPFEGTIEFGEKKRAEVKAAFESAHQDAKNALALASRARNDAATCAQKLRAAEAHWHQVKARPDALREAIAERENELARLENDEITPEKRSALLDELNQTLARARLDLGDVQSRRREMGDSVSSWKLEEARRAAALISETREVLTKNEVAKRRDLFHACGQDAGAEIQRLEAQIESLETEVARHEARLRGLMLLDAALQAERARLSRDLAGPLNEKIGPWLSNLRGKETRLTFDEAGSKIESVLSSVGEATFALPFGEHSEGFKEQVAFALRLLLARRIAGHLPSKRLPIVLDDPFTQSDSARRGGLGEVLQDAATSLQILFVTCHDAPKIAGLEANLIRIGAWDETAPARVKSAPKPAKKAEKIVMETALDGETLALF